MRRPLDLQPLVDAVAFIDEARCIGCTLCIQACPVDAIVGASRLMHTVIETSCIGCELCLPPCPVDCIEVRSIPPRGAAAFAAATARAVARYEARNSRLLRIQKEHAVKSAAQREVDEERRKRATIARAIERARQRLGERNS